MSDRNTSDWFGGRGRGSSQGWPGNAMWDAMDQLRGSFEQRTGSRMGPGARMGSGARMGGGPRMGRGDVRAAVLALLAEKPMHGYQIIQEIGERSHGAWKPSPGSVYPTLQLLADEGLIRAEEEGGRKTYSLTDEGKEAADAATTGKAAPWEASEAREGSRTGALPRAGIDLAQAVAEVGRSGKPEQVKETVAVLDEARRKIFSILAQD